MNLKIEQFTFNHYEMNCYVVYDDASKVCAIVDPGAEASYEDAQLTQFVDEKGLTPTLVLLTHAHVDHLAGLKEVCEHYHLPVTLHHDGLRLLKSARVYGEMMGFELESLGGLETQFVEGGTLLDLSTGKPTAEPSDLTIACLHVPGHCPGSLCFVLHKEQCVLTGDTLFHLSIGRADLPGGDPALLLASIKSQLLTLPDDYAVLPGHAIRSTIGKERKHNPWIQ